MAITLLNLLELGEVLQLNPPNLLTMEQAVRDRLWRRKSLLVVQEDDSRNQIPTVRLVHYSFQEHIFNLSANQDPLLSYFGLEIKDTHLSIARYCFIYFRDHIGNRRYWDCRNEEENLIYPLMRYAIRSWGEHAKRSADRAARLIQEYHLSVKAGIGLG